MAKKTLSLLLAGIFVLFSFAACGKKAIVGKWETEVKFGDLLKEEMGGDELGMDLSSFDLDSISMKLIVDMKDDGTFVMTADEDSVKECYDKIVDVMFEMTSSLLESMGMSIEDSGMSEEDMRKSLAEEIDMDDFIGTEEKGTYEEADGVVTLKDEDGEKLMTFENVAKDSADVKMFMDDQTLSCSAKKSK